MPSSPSPSPSPALTQDPYVISFRKDSHVFSPSECTFRDYSDCPWGLPKPLQEIYQILSGIFISGYLFWGWFVGCILFGFYWLGYWWISLIVLAVYIPYFLTPFHTKLGQPWDAVRKSIFWRDLQQYCQMEIVRLYPIDPTRRYILGFYPHNLLLLSRVAMYGGVLDEIYPGLDFRVLGASTMFYIPMCRELCLYLGAVDAGKKTAERVLTSHSKNVNDNKIRYNNPLSLIVYPGGVSEMLLTSDKNKEIILIPRKGFIKLSLQYGADLIPSFVFNEEKYYKKVYSNWAIQSEKYLWQKLKFPWVWFYGKFCTLLPYQPKGRPLTVIFGKPIRIEQKIENPTEQQIDELYQKFHEEIHTLFHTYKEKLGYEKDDTILLKPAEEKNNNHQKKQN